MLIQHAVVNQFDNKKQKPLVFLHHIFGKHRSLSFCKFRRNFVSKASFHKPDKQTCNWSLGILKSLLSLSRNQYYLLNNLFDGRQMLLLLQYLTRKDFRHLKANPSLFGARVILIDPMIQIATSIVTWNMGDMSSNAGFCGNPTGFLITSNLNVFRPFPTF